LRSRKTFRKFWNTCRNWRQCAGEAISLCLDALEVTGIDEDSGELNAFWAETFEEGGEFLSVEEWVVTLFRNEHTWTRFLNDSPECLTMAVMDPRCLDFNDAAGWGRRCRKPGPTSDGNWIACKLGFPVLETAILINESIIHTLIKKGQLEMEETERRGIYTWSERLEKNTRFSLGNQGTLTVYTKSDMASPLIMSWSPIKSEMLQEVKNVGFKGLIIGDHVERHHQEYIRGSWKCKPLRVLVLSRSTGRERE
jgi:hypothetical protein